MELLKKRMEQRESSRAKWEVMLEVEPNETTQMLLMMTEISDDYLQAKLESDKVLEGLLKDIHNATESGLDRIAEALELKRPGAEKDETDQTHTRSDGCGG